MLATPKRGMYRGRPADYYCHSLSKRTLIQSAVLGLIGGPIICLLKGGDSLLWCMAAMALAPFVVDAMKPTIAIKS